MLGEGKSIAEVAKALEVSEPTYHRWRNQYGGMKADDAKRLKELEREIAQLKRIVADQALREQALKELAKGNFLSPARRRRAVLHLQERFGVSERWACQLVGQHRSTHRHQPDAADADAALRALLGAFSAERPRGASRRRHDRPTRPPRRDRRTQARPLPPQRPRPRPHAPRELNRTL